MSFKCLGCAEQIRFDEGDTSLPFCCTPCVCLLPLCTLDVIQDSNTYRNLMVLTRATAWKDSYVTNTAITNYKYEWRGVIKWQCANKRAMGERVQREMEAYVFN